MGQGEGHSRLGLPWNVAAMRAVGDPSRVQKVAVTWEPPAGEGSGR